MTAPALLSFLNGAAFLAAWTIALFFHRFYRSTGDRLFGFFAASFVLLGAERIAIEILASEPSAWVYLLRLAAFLLILAAIFEKNRGAQTPPRGAARTMPDGVEPREPRES